MSSEDLVAFLRARLDEDERVARAAGWHRWQLGIMYGTVHAPGNGKTVAMGCREYDAEHIARHDPARVLRELAVKRALLAEHRREGYGCSACWEQEPDSLARDGDEMTHPDWPCLLVRRLASVYENHPDYRGEWAPEEAAKST